MSKKLFHRRTGLKTFHVTFVFKKNKIISIGLNSKKTHPKTKLYNYKKDACLHSELDAILRLNDPSYKDYTFVNIRLKKDKTLANSKPCEGCSQLLKSVKFKKFLYSNDEDGFEHFSS